MYYKLLQFKDRFVRGNRDQGRVCFFSIDIPCRDWLLSCYLRRVHNINQGALRVLICKISLGVGFRNWSLLPILDFSTYRVLIY